MLGVLLVGVLLGGCTTGPARQTNSESGAAVIEPFPGAHALTGRAAVRPDLSQLAPGDKVPVPIDRPGPVFPFSLYLKQASGEAVIEFIVEKDGTVAIAQAVSATHDAFGRAAEEAVKKWRFQPGLKGGRPVRTRMQVPILFDYRAAPAPSQKK